MIDKAALYREALQIAYQRGSSPERIAALERLVQPADLFGPPTQEELKNARPYPQRVQERR